MELSVVIPSYNEEENILALYEQLVKALQGFDSDYEILFVDDGSNDGTFHRLLSLHKKDSRVKIIKLKKNFGQSAAMAAGFDYAQGNVIVTMDADLQNDPADIPTLLQVLGKDFDVVCGWRRDRKDSFQKKIFSKFSNWLRTKLVGDSIHDSGCTLRAYKRECLNGVELYGEMHRYLPTMLSSEGYKVSEVNVAHRPRIAGKTKYNWQRLPKGGLDLILTVFWQRYSTRPIHMFGGLGALLATVGVLLGIYLGVERIFLGAALADRPLLLLAILLVIIGIQFLLFGILVDIILRVYRLHNSRKNYLIEKVIE